MTNPVLQQRRHAHHVEHKLLRQTLLGGPLAVAAHGLSQQLAVHARLNAEFVRCCCTGCCFGNQCIG
jgi:hypothetical protein